MTDAEVLACAKEVRENKAWRFYLAQFFGVLLSCMAAGALSYSLPGKHGFGGLFQSSAAYEAIFHILLPIMCIIGAISLLACLVQIYKKRNRRKLIYNIALFCIFCLFASDSLNLYSNSFSPGDVMFMIAVAAILLSFMQGLLTICRFALFFCLSPFLEKSSPIRQRPADMTAEQAYLFDEESDF